MVIESPSMFPSLNEEVALGTIKRGRELGRGRPNDKYVYIACLDCGERKWVTYGNLKRGLQVRCNSCAQTLRKHALFPALNTISQFGDDIPLGTLAYGRAIGKVKARDRFIYIICPHCKRRRWLAFQTFKGHPNHEQVCHDCEGINRRYKHPAYKDPNVLDIAWPRRAKNRSHFPKIKLLCNVCQQEHWTSWEKYQATGLECRHCGYIRRAKTKAPDKRIGKDGYVVIRVPSTHPFACMAAKRHSYKDWVWIQEHRFVLAQKIGRALLPKEQTHHIDGDKANNDPSNLELVSPANHTLKSVFCRTCNSRKKLRTLKKEYKRLQEENSELRSRLWLAIPTEEYHLYTN